MYLSIPYKRRMCVLNLLVFVYYLKNYVILNANAKSGKYSFTAVFVL